MARYSAAGRTAWLSIWKGPDDLGGECDALCLGTTGLFAAGSVTTTANGTGAEPRSSPGRGAYRAAGG